MPFIPISGGGGGGQEIFIFFCDKEGIFIKNVSFYTKENSLTRQK
ncbi:hypothetical protein ACIRXL_00225 [Avibacterium paragallinarum]